MTVNYHLLGTLIPLKFNCSLLHVSYVHFPQIWCAISRILHQPMLNFKYFLLFLVRLVYSLIRAFALPDIQVQSKTYPSIIMRPIILIPFDL